MKNVSKKTFVAYLVPHKPQIKVFSKLVLILYKKEIIIFLYSTLVLLQFQIARYKGEGRLAEPGWKGFGFLFNLKHNISF